MKRLSRRKRAEADWDSPSWKANLASLSLPCAGWSPAPSSSTFQQPRTEAKTVTQPRALEKQICIFSTLMYFRKRCRSNVFPCTERWTGPAVHPSQLLGCLSVWPAKGKERVWALVWMLMGQPPQVAP